jgi:acetyl-CoA acetyltransferase
MVSPGNEACIVGIGQTEFSRESGRSEQQLCAEAILAACADAGLSPKDINGAMTFDLDNSDEVDLMRNLGTPEMKYSMRTPQGGAGSVTTLVHAKKAVESGLCDVMVIWRAMNERSQYRFGQPHTAVNPKGMSSTFMEWCMPYGAQTPAAWEALSATPYLERYGVTSGDLGRISVLFRQNAATNPAAWFYGKPITLEDHQKSRWIVPPHLGQGDCSAPKSASANSPVLMRSTISCVCPVMCAMNSSRCTEPVACGAAPCADGAQSSAIAVRCAATYRGDEPSHRSGEP